MALGKKKAAPKKAKAKPAQVEKPLSDKERVAEKFKGAKCSKLDNGKFVIFAEVDKADINLSGRPSQTESDAWKRAAHNV